LSKPILGVIIAAGCLQPFFDLLEEILRQSSYERLNKYTVLPKVIEIECVPITDQGVSGICVARCTIDEMKPNNLWPVDELAEETSILLRMMHVL